MPRRSDLPAPTVAIGATVLVLGLLAGCQGQGAANRQVYSGTSTAATVSGVQQVVLTVNSQFRFAPSTVTVHPGKVKLTLQYEGSTGPPHDWQLVGIPADYVPLTTPGQQASVTFTAPATGTYRFECTIHIKQGQLGTLVVLPG